MSDPSADTGDEGGRPVKPSGRRPRAKGRAIGRDDWERIVDAVANGARGLRPVARIAGVHTSTVKRAMETGWPEQDLPPVPAELKKRRATARALSAVVSGVEVTADGTDVRTDSMVRAALPSTLYQVAEESQTLEMLRKMGLKLAQTASRMADAGDEVCEVALAKLAEQVESNQINPLDAMRVVNATASMGKTVVDLLGELMKLHRLVLGQPGEIIGHKVVATTEEALEILDRGTRQAARVRQLGLVALPGGRGDGEDTDDGLEGPGED